MAVSDNLKRGTLELCVLTLLSSSDMYGYEISQTLLTKSNGLYQIQETSLYPTLYRLVEKECITSRTEKVGKRRVRVYYHIEAKGLEYLKCIRKEYLLHAVGVFKILDLPCQTKGIINEQESD